jgi:flagella basal body P-ring formation protein FlgA
MIALLLSLSLSAPASGATVTLPVEARVKGTEITLGEVAQVSGLDAELVGRLRAIELGYSPAPGFSRMLTAERVRQALAKEFPAVEVRVTGERACRLWPEVTVLEPAAIEAAARTELARTFAGKEATYHLKDALASVQVPVGDVDQKVVARAPAGEPKSGVLGVPVEIHVDGLRYRTVWTSWTVEVWETRPVLTRPVKAGEELRPDLFGRARVQVGRAAELEHLDPAQLSGTIAKRDLAPGQAVTALDVHRPAAVTLGSNLFLRVRKGSIEARVSAVALETGAVGDRVRVRTLQAGQEMQATVVGRDLCEIVL